MLKSKRTNTDNLWRRYKDHIDIAKRNGYELIGATYTRYYNKDLFQENIEALKENFKSQLGLTNTDLNAKQERKLNTMALDYLKKHSYETTSRQGHWLTKALSRNYYSFQEVFPDKQIPQTITITNDEGQKEQVNIKELIQNIHQLNVFEPRKDSNTRKKMFALLNYLKQILGELYTDY